MKRVNCWNLQLKRVLIDECSFKKGLNWWVELIDEWEKANWWTWQLAKGLNWWVKLIDEQAKANWWVWQLAKGLIDD